MGPLIYSKKGNTKLILGLGNTTVTPVRTRSAAGGHVRVVHGDTSPVRLEDCQRSCRVQEKRNPRTLVVKVDNLGG